MERRLLWRTGTVQDAPQNCFAEAMEFSQVCLLSRSDMNALLTKKPSVAAALLAAVSARLAQAERFIGDLALKSVEERLVSWLMMEAETGIHRDGEIEISSPLSREEQPSGQEQQLRPSAAVLMP